MKKIFNYILRIVLLPISVPIAILIVIFGFDIEVKGKLYLKFFEKELLEIKK